MWSSGMTGSAARDARIDVTTRLISPYEPDHYADNESNASTRESVGLSATAELEARD